MYTARSAGASSFETPTLVKVSGGFDNDGVTAGIAAWGDFAVVAADPSDGSFWLSHEWHLDSQAGHWSTWWAQVQMPAHDTYVNWNAPNPSIQDGSLAHPYTTVGVGYGNITRGTLHIYGGHYNEQLTLKGYGPVTLQDYANGPVTIGIP